MNNWLCILSQPVYCTENFLKGLQSMPSGPRLLRKGTCEWQRSVSVLCSSNMWLREALSSAAQLVAIWHAGKPLTIIWERLNADPLSYQVTIYLWQVASLFGDSVSSATNSRYLTEACILMYGLCSHCEPTDVVVCWICGSE